MRFGSGYRSSRPRLSVSFVDIDPAKQESSPGMAKLRFGIRSIAALTVAMAVFCLGYQLGFERGDKNRIDTLHRIIQSTVGNGQWEQLGGPQTTGGGLSILTTDGCIYYDVDANGTRTIHPTNSETTNVSDDPFGGAVDEDPFR
ncbi:MAG: hypothetical protein AAGG48_31945 [Planctomycetota bacterium]